MRYYKTGNIVIKSASNYIRVVTEDGHKWKLPGHNLYIFKQNVDFREISLKYIKLHYPELVQYVE